MKRVHPEIIWAYDIMRLNPKPIHLAFDISIERVLGGEEVLLFSMFPNDPKLSWTEVDYYLEYAGRGWTVLHKDDVRTNSELYVEFTAIAGWYNLGDQVKFQAHALSSETVGGGAAIILEDAPWSVGDSPLSDATYSLEVENVSLLEYLRGWANVTNTELEFDSVNNLVHFRDELGEDRGVGFRYGRNLDEIKRSYSAPTVTRMYPVGANSMGIEVVNDGLPYVENFDWYVSQGMDLDTARFRFQKQAIWVDERYLLALNLMDAAVAKLQELSHPIISYECRVVDVGDITGSLEDQYNVGDRVRVADETFGIDISTRIVRMITRPYEPWNNTVELNYLQPGLNNDLVNSLSTGSGGGGQYRLLVAENEGIGIADSTLFVCTIDFTSSDNAYGIIGGLLVGAAIGSGTLTVQVYADSNQIGTDIEIPFVNGQRINVGIPSWFAQLESGTHVISLRARVTTGTGTILLPEFGSRLYVFMTGVVGAGVGGGGGSVLNIADEVDAVGWTPITASNAETLQTPIEASASDAVSEETISPTEGPPDVDIV